MEACATGKSACRGEGRSQARGITGTSARSPTVSTTTCRWQRLSSFSKHGTAQHSDPGPPGMLGEAIEVALCLLGPQQSTESGPAHFKAAAPERLPVVLRISQATQVGVRDASLCRRLPETGLAEALFAADRREPDVRHHIDTAVEERGDERVAVPAVVPRGPQARSGLGLPEQLVEGDLKGLGNCYNGEETWLDRPLALQASQRPCGGSSTPWRACPASTHGPRATPARAGRVLGRGRGDALSDGSPCAVFLTAVAAERHGVRGHPRVRCANAQIRVPSAAMVHPTVVTTLGETDQDPLPDFSQTISRNPSGA